MRAELNRNTRLVGKYIVIHGTQTAQAVAARGLAGIALLSGYWYARNALLTGTPLYPKGVLGARGILAETQPRLWHTTLLGARDPAVAVLADLTFCILQFDLESPIGFQPSQIAKYKSQNRRPNGLRPALRGKP